MENTNTRVCTQIKIDPSIIVTIKTTNTRGKITLIEPATIVVQRDTLPNTAPKHHFGASGVTQPHMIHKLADQNPSQAHQWNHQVQVATTQPNHPTSIIPQAISQCLCTQHNHPQLHQAAKNGPSY